MFPNLWQDKTLGDLITLQRGYDLPSQDRVDGNVPIMSAAGLAGFHIKSNVTGPGIVIGRSGSGFGSVHFSKSDYWAHNTALFVKDFKGNDVPYVFYLLNSINFSSYNSGGVQPSLNRNFIYPIRVGIPPLSEQRKIGQILSTWDKAIATTERLLANKQQQKKALMQRLLTGKQRFAQYVNSSQTQTVKYGVIPADWSYVSIGDIAKSQSAKNTLNQELPVLSCSKYDGFVDSLKYFNKKVYSDDTSTYLVVRRGWFAFPSNHIEEGSIGYQNLYDAGLVSPIYTVFETDNTVNHNFLYALLKTEHYRQIFAASTNASVDRRGSLRWKEFSMIKIPLPSIDEQNDIADVLLKSDAELKVTKEYLENLKQQKKALMQQLLTGKRRVEVDEVAA